MYLKKIAFRKIIAFSFACVLYSFATDAQIRSIKPNKTTIIDDSKPNINLPNSGNTVQSNNSVKDTLGFEHRDDSKDSVSISFVLLDSISRHHLDSSIDDFDHYYSAPSNYVVLGNNGAASRPIIFKPITTSGFDNGFHSFDVYKLDFSQSRFYNTTKPFTAINYQLASGKEQMIKVLHTQNPRPNLNVGFDYKLITAPGYFVTQNTNHNAYRIFSKYSGQRKRYNAQLIWLGNTIRCSENGGVQNANDLLDPNRKDRFSVPVNMGSNAAFNNNPFVTAVKTGNQYRDFGMLIRQSYDFGKRDSVAIDDSTMAYLYYPKMRVQYTFRTEKNRFLFSDIAADSSLYSKWYNINLPAATDTLSFLENWKNTQHELSFIQYPDTKNLSQFLQFGVNYQQLFGKINNSELLFHNFSINGEYRNRTKNKKWDMLLNTHFYVNGFNAGDYDMSAYLFRSLHSNKSNVSVYFKNISRTPSFIFDTRSSFNLGKNESYQKEQTLLLGATLNNSICYLGITNYILTNYTYFKNYFQHDQYQKTIGLMQINASKNIHFSKKWVLRSELTIQKTDDRSPIRVPLVYTRNRLAFEGHYFKNLDISTGLDVRYYSSYKAYGYSPVVGQFFVQDSVAIKNLPDISLYTHFRIRSFAGYLRAENLNTAYFNNGFNWVNNNFAAPLYPTQGFMFRFGIQWWFVN